MSKQAKDCKSNLIKGGGRAFILSLLFHTGFVTLAMSMIVFVIPVKSEKKFVPAPSIKLPKIPREKVKVPTRRPSKPRMVKRISTSLNTMAFSKYSFPELVKGKMNIELGEDVEAFSFLEVPDIEEGALFGQMESTGNDFSGRLYDVKRWRNGHFNSIRGEEIKRGTPDTFRTIIYRYIKQGWKQSVISKYYRSQKLYTTHFCFPAVPSSMAADQFGVPETEGYFFFMKYSGQLVFPRDITFRFWCTANSFGMVQVNGKEVLVAGWEMHVKFFDWWEPVESVWNTQYVLSDRWMAPSDWITLKAGVPVPMNVLIGNRGHNAVSFVLLVEEKGKKYPTRSIGGPLLPIFKTEELSQDMLDQIMNFLPADEANLTNGPIFRTF